MGEGLRVPNKGLVAGNDGVLRSKFLNQKGYNDRNNLKDSSISQKPRTGRHTAKPGSQVAHPSSNPKIADKSRNSTNANRNVFSGAEEARKIFSGAGAEERNILSGRGPLSPAYTIDMGSFDAQNPNNYKAFLAKFNGGQQTLDAMYSKARHYKDKNEFMKMLIDEYSKSSKQDSRMNTREISDRRTNDQNNWKLPADFPAKITRSQEDFE